MQAENVETPVESLIARVAQVLSDLGDSSTWSLVLALAAAATIAMAILQLIKDLSPLRRWYQRWWVERWIDVRHKGLYGTCSELTATEDAPAQAKQDLVELSTGGLADALYVLPTEELAAQVSQAAEITLDSPKRYGVLLCVLAYGVADTDLCTVREGQPSSGSTQQYFDARNRAARRIQRNIDGLRIALGHDWKFWMQLASVGMTTLIVMVAVAARTDGLDALFVAFWIGLIGGYFAPLTRDLVAAIQRLRKPL